VRLSSPRISCMRRTPRRSGSRSSSRTDSGIHSRIVPISARV
jgi:hypothetical protein